MDEISALAPAKINLYLNVLKKREDGYHDILTLFERINLFDKLTFQFTSDSTLDVSCNCDDVADGRDNLVYKAVELLRTVTKKRFGVRVFIDKKIPVCAGLGGGSSDAATALWVINKHLQLGLGQERLSQLGSTLGADVPFFLSGSMCALGRKKGELIENIDVTTLRKYILVYPQFPVSTASVYNSLKNVELTKYFNNVNILLYALRQNNFSLIGKAVYNRLKTVAFTLEPRLADVYEELLAFEPEAIELSGSGSIIWMLVESSRLQATANALTKRWQIFLVESLKLEEDFHGDYGN